MAVSPGSLRVGVSDDRLDTTKVTQADDTIAHREAVVITDPEELDARLNLREFRDLYRMQTLGARDAEILLCLGQILEALNVIKLQMEELTEIPAYE